MYCIFYSPFMHKILLYLMILWSVWILSSCSGNIEIEKNSNMGRYRVEKDRVYYEDKEVQWTDPKTFQVLTGALNFWKDENAVFYCDNINCLKIDGADPKTFKMVTDNDFTFWKDENAVFYCTSWHDGCKVIEGANPTTFALIDKSYAWTKDENAVFYSDLRMKDADPKTFALLKGGHYGKDKNTVYFYKNWDGINGADVASFETIDVKGKAKDQYTFYENGEKVTSAVQKNYVVKENEVSWGNLTIESADPATFISLKSGYAKDKNNVYFDGGKITNADPATFVIYKNMYGRDKNAIYTGSERTEIGTKTDENGTYTVYGNGLISIEPKNKTASPLKSDQSTNSSITINKEEEEYLKENTFYSCGNEKCFNEKFASCLPVTMTSDAQIFWAVLYEVKNKTQNGCRVAFKYTRYPDPKWVDQEIVCEVNNKIGFQEAWSKVFENVTNGTLKCTGPLYDILRPQI